MFDINAYPFDTEHNYMEVAGEAMIFHCHHYLGLLQRTILDAEYIDSRPFLIGSSADANYNQLKHLCEGHSVAEAKLIAQEVYKTFGYGLLDLAGMNENGITLFTTKSFFSKTWKLKFGAGQKPVDYYTSGFLAAAYAVIYGRELVDSYHKCITR